MHPVGLQRVYTGRRSETVVRSLRPWLWSLSQPCYKAINIACPLSDDMEKRLSLCPLDIFFLTCYFWGHWIKLVTLDINLKKGFGMIEVNTGCQPLNMIRIFFWSCQRVWGGEILQFSHMNSHENVYMAFFVFTAIFGCVYNMFETRLKYAKLSSPKKHRPFPLPNAPCYALNDSKVYLNYLSPRLQNLFMDGVDRLC